SPPPEPPDLLSPSEIFPPPPPAPPRPPPKPPDEGTPPPSLPPSPSSQFNSPPSRPPPKPPPSSLLFCENYFDGLALKSTSKNPSAPLDHYILILGQSEPLNRSTIRVRSIVQSSINTWHCNTPFYSSTRLLFSSVCKHVTWPSLSNFSFTENALQLERPLISHSSS
ncbi:hypothetical protein A2U01_0049777, partial [Trifolium medium]|nr:hypothetical protein [Trifolium medium]